ncbi:hypothetical protein [Halomonas sp. M20]|uniref:hypothetical protein n=1 Tax=Halomonas sp. M20 TaxID=2763264 RepID=UPI001D0ACA80|nr:hypothetical protein [Halomonas sp. M20]
MQTDGFFNWLGESIGEAIRAIVDLLSGFFAGIGVAIYEFVEGLSGSLGVNTSLFNMVVLVIGLLLLIKGISSFVGRSIIGGVIWTVAGLLVLSWLMA